jgi:hypothetical protein
LSCLHWTGTCQETILTSIFSEAPEVSVLGRSLTLVSSRQRSGVWAGMATFRDYARRHPPGPDIPVTGTNTSGASSSDPHPVLALVIGRNATGRARHRG